LTADAPHLMAEEGKLGYGFQWWLLDGDEGEFTALGFTIR